MVSGNGTDIRCRLSYGSNSYFAQDRAVILTLTQADLGSAMPTSGGLYWWTHFFSSPSTRNPLCFLVGYSNMLGLVGGLCSVDCMFLVSKT